MSLYYLKLIYIGYHGRSQLWGFFGDFYFIYILNYVIKSLKLPQNTLQKWSWKLQTEKNLGGLTAPPTPTELENPSHYK